MGIFNFKQFSVNDDNCSMKVGTDAVLLGAWCEVGDAKRILDIGTGSGVIALMLAQRSIIDARIDAVEMLPHDASQAKENVLHSPWPEKVAVIHARVQDFRPTEPYDLIVCNPPYFVKSLLPPNPGRAAVRHGGNLSHDELISTVNKFLMPSGKFHLILPNTESGQFREEAGKRGLHLLKLTRFFSRSNKPQQRSLMTFGLTPGNLLENSLFVYGPDRRRTEEYARLTANFYL